jgi:hypothetical protein
MNDLKWTTMLKESNERRGRGTVRITERREATHGKAIISILGLIRTEKNKISSPY